jgi:DDE superfamily endonuclease
MNTIALERLRAFRHAIYTALGCRRDALVEILDALLTTPVIEHPVHLSLAPGFQRTWGSIYDALNAGTMSLPRLENLVAAQPLETSTEWYAVDASLWPGCDAETSPDRGSSHQHSRHSNGQPIGAFWNSSWLVQLPERCSSWTAPLRVRRIQKGGKHQSGGSRTDSLGAPPMRSGEVPPNVHLRCWL